MSFRDILFYPKPLKPVNPFQHILSPRRRSKSIGSLFSFQEIPVKVSPIESTRSGFEELYKADLSQKTDFKIRPDHFMSSSPRNKHLRHSEDPFLLKNVLSLTNKKQKKEKLLKNVSSTIAKLFKGGELEISDFAFSPQETRLMVIVFVKKLLNEDFNNFPMDQTLNLPKQMLSDKLNEILNTHKSHKRTEENNKFVFKYITKELKKRFYAEKKLSQCKSSELLFYHEYFADTAGALSLPLDFFYDPLYKTVNQNPRFKSINNKYLKIVFQSPRFKADFFEFLENQFEPRYAQTIEAKITKILRGLKSKLYKSTSDGSEVDEIFRGFLYRLKRNKKCKLPWTLAEIRAAREQFTSAIYNY